MRSGTVRRLTNECDMAIDPLLYWVLVIYDIDEGLLSGLRAVSNVLHALAICYMDRQVRLLCRIARNTSLSGQLLAAAGPKSGE